MSSRVATDGLPEAESDPSHVAGSDEQDPASASTSQNPSSTPNGAQERAVLAVSDRDRHAPQLGRSREDLQSPGVSRLVVSANGISSYHGQTSALFDENPQDRLHGEFRPRVPDEWAEKGLVAEAAKQRKLGYLPDVGRIDDV